MVVAVTLDLDEIAIVAATAAKIAAAADIYDAGHGETIAGVPGLDAFLSHL